ncbi:hypothetical protein [Chitinophaga caeni]|nr:hypothetical protein [Chitinophaga caeni]
MGTIDELRKLELHDQCIEHIEIDFDEEVIRISFSIFVDIGLDDAIIIFEFDGIRRLAITMDLKEFVYLQIYSHELITMPGGEFSLRILMLQGPSEPSADLSFIFKRCRKL